MSSTYFCSLCINKHDSYTVIRLWDHILMDHKDNGQQTANSQLNCHHDRVNSQERAYATRVRQPIECSICLTHHLSTEDYINCIKRHHDQEMMFESDDEDLMISIVENVEERIARSEVQSESNSKRPVPNSTEVQPVTSSISLILPDSIPNNSRAVVETTTEVLGDFPDDKEDKIFVLTLEQMQINTLLDFDNEELVHNYVQTESSSVIVAQDDNGRISIDVPSRSKIGKIDQSDPVETCEVPIIINTTSSDSFPDDDDDECFLRILTQHPPNEFVPDFNTSYEPAIQEQDVAVSPNNTLSLATKCADDGLQSILNEVDNSKLPANDEMNTQDDMLLYHVADFVEDLIRPEAYSDVQQKLNEPLPSTSKEITNAQSVIGPFPKNSNFLEHANSDTKSHTEPLRSTSKHNEPVTTYIDPSVPTIHGIKRPHSDSTSQTHGSKFVKVELYTYGYHMHPVSLRNANVSIVISHGLSGPLPENTQYSFFEDSEENEDDDDDEDDTEENEDDDDEGDSIEENGDDNDEEDDYDENEVDDDEGDDDDDDEIEE